MSLLSMGELRYEVYVPAIKELDQLKEKGKSVYETYWEMLCHFRICVEVLGMRGQGVGQKTCAFYHFCNLDQAHIKVMRYEGLNDDPTRERISDLKATSYVS